MRELELKKENQIEVSVKQKKQQEHVLVNQITPFDGHVIWKINNETLEIEPAKFLNSATFFAGPQKKEIMVIDNHTYVSALNKKNALKKFSKGENGSKPVLAEPCKLI